MKKQMIAQIGIALTSLFAVMTAGILEGCTNAPEEWKLDDHMDQVFLNMGSADCPTYMNFDSNGELQHYVMDVSSGIGNIDSYFAAESDASTISKWYSNQTSDDDDSDPYVTDETDLAALKAYIKDMTPAKVIYTDVVKTAKKSSSKLPSFLRVSQIDSSKYSVDVSAFDSTHVLRIGCTNGVPVTVVDFDTRTSWRLSVSSTDSSTGVNNFTTTGATASFDYKLDTDLIVFDDAKVNKTACGYFIAYNGESYTIIQISSFCENIYLSSNGVFYFDNLMFK